VCQNDLRSRQCDEIVSTNLSPFAFRPFRDLAPEPYSSTSEFSNGLRKRAVIPNKLMYPLPGNTEQFSDLGYPHQIETPDHNSQSALDV